MRRNRLIIARTLATTALVAALAAEAAGNAEAATPDIASGPWAAIAVGPTSGHTGYARNYPSQNTVADAARRACNARDCRSVVEVSNGCAALAQAPNTSLGWAYARSATTAQRAAVQATGSSRARVIGTVCSGDYQR